jgi:hypothetical protein
VRLILLDNLIFSGQIFLKISTKNYVGLNVLSVIFDRFNQKCKLQTKFSKTLCIKFNSDGFEHFMSKNRQTDRQTDRATLIAFRQGDQ